MVVLSGVITIKKPDRGSIRWHTWLDQRVLWWECVVTVLSPVWFTLSVVNSMCSRLCFIQYQNKWEGGCPKELLSYAILRQTSSVYVIVRRIQASNSLVNTDTSMREIPLIFYIHTLTFQFFKFWNVGGGVKPLLNLRSPLIINECSCQVCFILFTRLCSVGFTSLGCLLYSKIRILC